MQRLSGSSTPGVDIFHGQGSGNDTENTDILRFFHLVADGVEDVLGGQTVPLVFMGVDFLFPIYRQANSYPHLMDEAVAHQPDQLSPEEIRDRAYEVMKSHFSADKEAVKEEYGNLLDKQQATSDLTAILNASHDGQIDTLFVAEDTQKWGSFDASSRAVDVTSERQDNSQDLLNLAATQAMYTDAKVYIVPREEVPGEADMAATLRYPIPASGLASAV